MKKLLGLFALLVILLVGCSKEKDGIDNYYGYHIQNTDGIDKESLNKCMVSQDSTFLSGIKNRKIWIGLFNEQTKEQLDEWEGTEILADNIKNMRLGLLSDGGQSFYTFQKGYILSGYSTNSEGDIIDVNNYEFRILILCENIVNMIDTELPFASIYEETVFVRGNSEQPGKLFSLKGDVLVDDVTAYPSYSSLNDSLWLSGVKNRKMWIGLFNECTKKQLQEWEGTDLLSDNLKRINLSTIYNVKNGFVFNAFLHYSDKGKKEQVLFLSDNIIAQVECPFNPRISILDDAILISGVEQANKLFSTKGKLLVNDVSSYNKGDSTFLSGFKDDKIWFGMYNADKKLLKEWISNNKFERTIIYDAGYGETKEIYVDCILRSGTVSDFFLEENWGYVYPSLLSSILPYNDRPKGLFLLNDNSVYFYFSKLGIYNVVNWFNGSILIPGEVVLSSECELITNIGYNPNYYNYDKEDAISYTEIIHQYYSGDRHCYMVRSDLKEGKEIWKTKIDKLDNIQSNAKVTHTITQKNGQIWTYHYEVVNFDGSKESFDLSINVETGVLTYL